MVSGFRLAAFGRQLHLQVAPVVLRRKNKSQRFLRSEEKMKKTIVICVFCAFIVSFVNAEQVQLTLQPIDNGLSVAHIKESARPDNGAIIAGNVPSYYWHYGCSPTSGGMIVGYWDSKPGYQNLFYGDASVQNAATRDMIASPAHITAGTQNGYTYGDWHNSTSYPDHESNPDCIADFMHTVDGGSTSANIASGLEAYVEWDNPATPINESYQATALSIDDPYWGGSFTYSSLKAEIDADRPVLLDVYTYHVSEWYGHSIACYGYQDSMFTICPPTGTGNIIVPGVAVDDTWQNGTAMSEWLLDTNDDKVADSSYNSYIDPSSGIEWWPYYTDSDAAASSYVSYWDWSVGNAVTLDIVIPEPATICMFALGVLGLLRKRKV
jgi:hypothetical protein